MQPIIGLAQGKVGGQEVDGVSSFLGIPYAAPISGPALFEAPAQPTTWDGVRDATRFGATVPKPPYVPPFDQLLTEPVISGDEALNANVWTPDPGGRGLPVMVWIHGGAFRNGSNAIPAYDGTAFARDGVVLVSINYRLGVPGFAQLPDAPANRGILDQLAALAWVQENIAAFGGDPDQVTIFGESAGGMSVATLVSAAGQGLFRRAIAQSGAGHHAATADDARLVTAELAARLDVAPTAHDLAEVDLQRLVDTQHAVSLDVTRSADPNRWGRSIAGSMMAFLPVVDGELITERPVDAVTAGAGRDVTLLIGANTDEHRFFLTPVGVTDATTSEALQGFVSAQGWDPAVIDLYSAARPDASPGDLLASLMTDSFFRVPAIRLAEGHLRAGGTNYHYEFAWPAPDGRLGACHTLEIPFAFDNGHLAGAQNLVGANPPQALADTMHAAWISFARTGNPGWQPYDLNRRTVMTFNHPESLPVDDPRAAERACWDGVV